MNSKIETNRDLYRRVTQQLKKRKHANRTLESYLSRLWQLVIARQAESPLRLDEFAEVLDAAFDGKAPDVEYDGLRAIAAKQSTAPWLRQLAQQIVDLHEMDRAGTLRYKYRSFGVNAPSGTRWYNFDPFTFIECGLSGTSGGWDPEDDTDRVYVPGPVAVLDADGNITTANPEDIDEPVIPMERISWEEFDDFLWAGQNYE